MAGFTHLDANGKVNMVDVSHKPITLRTATALSVVHLPEIIQDAISEGDIQTKKGSVIHTAIISGIMAAKKTGELIPLCHPIGLDNCNINIKFNGKEDLEIECITSVEGKTGVEMEALVGATIAALTVYDMCKAMSHDIIIKEIKLIHKSGGKNDFKRV